MISVMSSERRLEIDKVGVLGGKEGVGSEE
jgi:hypothetical protein